MPGSGYRMLDTGCWMLDARCWIIDYELKIEKNMKVRIDA